VASVTPRLSSRALPSSSRLAHLMTARVGVSHENGACPLMAIIGLFAAAFVLGLMVGILLGWAAAPAMVWQAPEEQPEGAEAPKPQAVGLLGAL
jgi:hypothetical protein